MIIVYIKENRFFKNVDDFGNVFEVKDKALYLENGFKEILLDEQYKDCKYEDFDENLEFSLDKYNARKQKENAETRIAELKPRLEQLSQDLIQAQAGAMFDNLDERVAEFRTLHNELRELLGKEPRKYFS